MHSAGTRQRKGKSRLPTPQIDIDQLPSPFEDTPSTSYDWAAANGNPGSLDSDLAHGLSRSSLDLADSRPYFDFASPVAHKNGYGWHAPQQHHHKWEKVLWKRQPFPDNYTDSSFLRELVVNADVPKRDYWRVVLGSAAVTQQLCTVTAAVAVPVHLRQGNFTAYVVLAVCAILLVTGYAVCCLVGGHILGGSLRRGIRQVTLLSGGVYLLSPLLHSLTKTISEDSIIAMTVGLLILHLYLHDYNFVNSVTDKLTGTVSLGAAVFASVLIASGMPSEFDVVCVRAVVHILFCLELYLLSPFMRRYIRQASLAAHGALTVGMVLTSVLLLLPLSPNLTTVFATSVVFISFFCPRWLVRIHKFKAKINGPWDEAVPKIPTSIHARWPSRARQKEMGANGPAAAAVAPPSAVLNREPSA